MKYSIHMNGREFLLMRDKTEIAVLEIGPDKTLEEARQMVADLNSIDAMRQMLCAEQAENAALRQALEDVTLWAETIEVVHAHPFMTNAAIVQARAMLAKESKS
jgi:3-oxoacyl-(acyl-carrier-protein) synthase